jgi:hypothetical protein
MFPIAKDKLSFIDISDYWARDIKPSASAMELLALLEQAWWLGEIRGISAVSRLQLLQNIFKAMRGRHDLGIVFVQGEDQTAAAEVTELENGAALVDLRHRIPVPADNVSDWDERTSEPAFQALAQTSSMMHYPDVAPALAAVELTHEEFFAWCEMRGFAKPTFWRSSAESSTLQKSQHEGAPDYNKDAILDSGTERYSIAPNAPRPGKKMPPMPREAGPRKEAWKALKAKFPDELIPDDYSGMQLHKIVNQHIQSSRDALEGRIRQQISLDTVLRAAGRKKIAGHLGI